MVTRNKRGTQRRTTTAPCQWQHRIATQHADSSSTGILMGMGIHTYLVPLLYMLIDTTTTTKTAAATFEDGTAAIIVTNGCVSYTIDE